MRWTERSSTAQSPFGMPQPSHSPASKPGSSFSGTRSTETVVSAMHGRNKRKAKTAWKDGVDDDWVPGDD